jgi:hypothetical protein
MKTFKLALAAVFCFGIVLAASAQNGTKQGYATAVRVEGDVTYSLGQGQPEYPLVAGKYLAPGSIIYTKDNGVCDLILGKSIDLPQAKWSPERISLSHDSPVRGFVTYKPTADQNAVRMTPHSTLVIEKLNVIDTGSDSVSDTELDLQKGKIFASVRKLTGASQYLIKLPKGVAGVRGTLFSITSEGECACYESTGGGVVLAVQLPGGGGTQTFVVSPGQILDNSTGQPANISPDLSKALNMVFSALRTDYFQEVSFEVDTTTGRVSPTSGHQDGHN